MEQVINEFLHLLYETESLVKGASGSCQTDDLERFLHDFRTKRINPLYRRLERLQGTRYVLSMVGLTNVGKSTLAEALLGHPVAPRRNRPATAIPVEYEFSHEWLFMAHLRGSQQVTKRVYQSAAELSKALEASVFGGSGGHPTRQQPIERIIVRGPMDLLESGMVFADTPGFGAAQTDEGEASHDQALVEYLKEQVHEVMFCVSGSNAMVTREEEQFFRDIQELCSTVVVTKWDSDPDARAREIKKYRDKFADLFPLCGFVFVEAKWAIEGNESSNIDNLKALIHERATAEKRVAAIRGHVTKAWEDLHELVREPLRKSGVPKVPWHKAALPRFRRAAADQNLQLKSLV